MQIKEPLEYKNVKSEFTSSRKSGMSSVAKEGRMGGWHGPFTRKTERVWQACVSLRTYCTQAKHLEGTISKVFDSTQHTLCVYKYHPSLSPRNLPPEDYVCSYHRGQE